MSRTKGALGALLAFVASTSMQVASAGIIDYYEPFVTTYGATQTDIVSGGDVSHMYAYDSSLVNLSGGGVSHLHLHDNSVLNMSGGSASTVTLRNNAAASVSAGTIGFLNVYDTSSATLFGAPTLSWLVVGENAHVDIHVSHASFTAGILTGAWLDGSPFEFWAVFGSPDHTTITERLPSNITLIRSVPEPATTLLMALGLIAAGVAGRTRRSKT